MTESAEPKEKRPRITVTLPGARSTPQQQQVGGVHLSSRREVCTAAAGGRCAPQQQAGGMHSSSRWEMCTSAAGRRFAQQQQVGDVHLSSRQEVCTAAELLSHIPSNVKLSCHIPAVL